MMEIYMKNSLNHKENIVILNQMKLTEPIRSLIHSSLNQKQREASGLLGNYPKCGTCLA